MPILKKEGNVGKLQIDKPEPEHERHGNDKEKNEQIERIIFLSKFMIQKICQHIISF